MAFEIATILLGAGLGAALVLYAAPRGYLGHPRRRAAAGTLTSFTPQAEQATETRVEAEPSPQPAPSPAPAIYENVQPEPAPTPALPSSSVVSFGSGSQVNRVHRAYRRRTAHVRGSSATRTVHHRPKKR